MIPKSVLESLNQALHKAMDADPMVFMLGEDLMDPYGGAFKVTRGLSTRFPGRVLTTPISEAAIVGMANGMAMRGMRPVVEIMFGDFVTLIADQVINHAAKFRWMYNDQVRVPIVIRTPMGGRRGYGPTHSQSLEKLFLGIPGIRVIAPNTLSDPGSLLLAAIADDDPVVFVEHKLLYNRPLLEAGKGELSDHSVEVCNAPYPVHVLYATNGAPDLTIACYGYNFELVRKAADHLLMEYEILTDIIVPSQLSPFRMDELQASVKKTGMLLTVEEGTQSLGWGAEIITRLAEAGVSFKAKRIAALDLPIGNSRSLEEFILPSDEDVVQKALNLMGRG